VNKKFSFDIFPQEQKSLFEKLSDQSWIRDFYLSGGTALALQNRHRKSIDFDFFTSAYFNTSKIISNITDIGKFELFTGSESTINGMLNNVQISFFKYKYPLINKSNDYKNIRIVDPIDIAAMKLEAISGRGSKKDFVDLYFLLKTYSLNTLFEAYQKKYNFEIANNYHLMKSILYFKDADREPMPVMMEKIEWSEIKKFLIHVIKDSNFK